MFRTSRLKSTNQPGPDRPVRIGPGHHDDRGSVVIDPDHDEDDTCG
jgi:hypothetical protein